MAAQKPSRTIDLWGPEPQAWLREAGVPDDMIDTVLNTVSSEIDVDDDAVPPTTLRNALRDYGERLIAASKAKRRAASDVR